MPAKVRLWAHVVPLLMVVVLVWLAPAERQLGKVAKLVYLHGAVVYAVFVLLFLASVTGLLAVAGSSRALAMVRGVFRAALVLMVVNVILAPVVTRMTWGMFFQWAEPRFVVTYALFFFTVGVGLIAGALGSSRWAGVFYALPAPLAWVLLMVGGRVFHPAGPVRNSESATIKAYFAAMLVTLLVLAAAVAAGQTDRGRQA